MKVKNFFDTVSGFYDEMINPDKVIASRKDLLKKLIFQGAKTAVDLGCGTGMDSISLGLNGLDVTGFDISENMIIKARINSKKYKLNTKLYKYPLDKIPVKFNNSFDIAVSLGNSMALIEQKKIFKSIERIYKMLKKNGQLVIQILNYTAIKKNNKRIVNITNSNNDVFVRFYDLFTTPINFNILRFDKNNVKDFELITTKLNPYDKNLMISMLKKTGFKNTKVYSSLNKEKFDIKKSKDLIIIAYKK